MGPEFFQTGMGRTFYEHTMPELVKVLQRIATALEKATAPKMCKICDGTGIGASGSVCAFCAGRGGA